jgi:hypothetical protein
MGMMLQLQVVIIVLPLRGALENYRKTTGIDASTFSHLFWQVKHHLTISKIRKTEQSLLPAGGEKVIF